MATLLYSTFKKVKYKINHKHYPYLILQPMVKLNEIPVCTQHYNFLGRRGSLLPQPPLSFYRRQSML